MSSARRRRVRRKPERPGRKGLPEPLLHLLLAAFALALFAGSPGAEFTYDDHLIVAPEESVAVHFEGLSFRPVRAMTFMVDKVLFGADPVGYHVHSLLWHLACVLLVFALARRLTQSAATAFAVAALFAAHPVHVEAVSNITNRKESLCMAFSLGALLAYARFLDRPCRERWRWLALAICSWLLGFGAKEVAVAVPLTALLYEWLFVPRERQLMLRRRALLAAVAMSGAAVMAALFPLFFDASHLDQRNTLNGYLGEPVWSHFALSVGRVFWMYVRLLVWPSGLCPDHVVALSSSFADPLALLGWLALLAFGVASVLVARRNAVAGFGLLWLLCHFLPISNLVPVLYMQADRYLYAPSFGYCLALVALAGALVQRLEPVLPRAREITVALGGLAIAAYGLQTVSYNRVWRNDATLWAHGVECNPLSLAAHTNLADQLRRQRDYDGALRHLDRAIEIKPRYAPNLGPRWSHLYSNRGAVHHQLHRYAAARADLERAVELDPDSASSHFNLGTYHRSRGDLVRARSSFRRAAALGMPRARRALEAMDRSSG